eukprot:CAMPEP_0171194970 /NCGR_PEP_ID=MMETSP0790-20130122/21160_1 /TAXON_ID=2925 /ORGANISM="Alexandrium catenella, Strain OF101" /LENGTH=116 /DNA_ID=CAMNT_0011660177 /DNA_START=69 /DNA_END=419 /DNA_ORIENTATION=-
MGEEVGLKLIFANDVATAEITTSLGQTVRDIKARIMEQHWPSSSSPIGNVERLRLFAGGKELGGKGSADAQSLREAKLTVSEGHPTPIHVVTVLKSAEPAPEGETTKPSQCFCTLL